jgi:hypothetical protein
MLILIPSSIPRTSIAGSYANSIFSLVRKLYVDLHCGCTDLHSYQQSEVFLDPTTHQHLLLVFLTMAVRVGWNLSVVLIGISLMARM